MTPGTFGEMGVLGDYPGVERQGGCERELTTNDTLVKK